MKKHPSFFLCAACAVFAATQTLFAQTPKTPPIQEVEKIAEPSVALVSFKFKAAVPGKAYIAFDGEWCPNCGRTHTSGIDEYLRGDKSFHVVGFYTARDEVMIQDLAIPPENIASIHVDGRPAEIAGVWPCNVAAKLKLREAEEGGTVALPDAGTPFAFSGDSKKPPAFAAVVNRQNLIRNRLVYDKQPGLRIHDSVISKIIPIDESTRFEFPVILLDKDGKPVSLSFDSYPQPYTMTDFDASVEGYSAADLAKIEAEVIGMAGKYIVPVTFKFRAPPKPAGQQAQRSRYSFSDDDDEGMEIMEFETTAYRVDDKRLLIHSGDEHIWRLSSITAKIAGEQIPAKFVHSLLRANMIIADLEDGAAPGIGRIDGGGIVGASGAETPMFAVSAVDAGGGKMEFSAARGMMAKAEPGWRDLPCYDSIASRYESGNDNSEYPDLIFNFGGGRMLGVAAWLIPLNSEKETMGGYSYNRPRTAILDIGQIGKFAYPDPSEIKSTVKPLMGIDRKPKGSFGLDLQPMTEELAKNRGLLRLTNGGNAGAIVSAVTPGSPAADAGVEENWVLLSIVHESARIPVTIQLDGDRYDSGNDFPWDRLDQIPEQYFSQIPAPWKAASSALDTALGRYGVGTKAEAHFILPGGRVETKTLTIAEAPPTYESAPFHNWREAGVTLCALTHEVRTYLGLDDDAPGLVVRGVRSGTPSVKAGLRPMELVTHINNEPLASLDDFKRLATAKGAFTLNVTRLDKSRLVVFEVK